MDNDSLPPADSKYKMPVHLLCEAFPDKFVFCVVIDRDQLGNLQDKCDVICSPKNESEMRAMVILAERLLGKA